MHQQIHLKQNQKLTFSQQMNLSLKILSWDIEQVLSYLEEETLNNPLMEINNSSTTLVKETLYTRSNSTRLNADNNEISALNYYSDEITLKDDLLMQLNTLKDLPESLVDATHLLIELLDDNGYLVTPLDDITLEYRFAEETLVEGLKIIQSFEPKGVGACSLSECLLLQLNQNDKIAEKIISHYLHDIADNKLDAIKTSLKVSLDDVIKAVDTIKSLNPKPGASYATNEFTKFVVPEALITIFDKQLQVEFYDELIPKVEMNINYLALQNQVDTKTKQYIQSKAVDVKNIQYSIQNRKVSIRKLISYVVDYQQDFFIKGAEHLKPLTQRELAHHFEVNESTISRAVKAKYLYTPLGLIELKDLFMEKLASNSDTTKNAVFAYIEQLVSQEDKSRPLSDNKITQKICEKGITLSRRTIAKYREEMGIANKQKRKIFI